MSGLGVFGGYFLNAQTALMLAFILSVTSVASLEATAPRVIGWIVAGGVAVLAGWLVWPRSSHVALLGFAASVIRAVAATIATPGQGARLERAARERLANLRRGFVVAQRRPSGATRRDRALAELETELDRALTFAASAAAIDSTAVTSEAAALRAAVVRALQVGAILLEGGSDIHDIEPLVTARDRAALDRWVAEQLSAGARPETVLDGLVERRTSGGLAVYRTVAESNYPPPRGRPGDCARGALRASHLDQIDRATSYDRR